MKTRHSLAIILCAATLMAVAPLHAATPPDAGQVLEQMNRPAQPLPPPTGLTIQPGDAYAPPPAGGAKAVVQRIILEGMSRFDEQTLLAALGEYQGRAFDLAGLHGLAERITGFYHAHGYPFALAYLPPQTVKTGTLAIRIIEGRYGVVRVVGAPDLKEGVEAFLSGLKPGEVIEAGPLERAIHILGDQPGLTFSPVLMPGADVGSGDLEVRVTEGRRSSGDIRLDNHGNRYTGAWRASATQGISRLFAFGDQLTLGALLTDEQLWYGRLGYSLPIGGSGLRAKAEYLQTSYELGGDFSSLGATGEARITTLGVSYPLRRSPTGNLSLSAEYHYKELEERPNNSASRNSKHSDLLPLALQFDSRDSLGGGGITWGVLTWTLGELDLDTTLHAVDQATARTEGGFSRLNLELARLQKLSTSITLYGRFSVQWTEDNLDSSEDFGLGGADGVRAYPQGEAMGDSGWLGQLELRYQAGSLSPYLFYDTGTVTINATPWAVGDNERSLSGGGIGIRFDADAWSLDACAAWRINGGSPQSDSKNDQPHLWVSAHYRF